MTRPPGNHSPKRPDPLGLQTPLGQLCGTHKLFCDRYQILKVLGRGGFGITFLAKDTGLPSDPLCVIKQLCPRVDNPRTRARSQQRFHQEATILGELGGHPQIPRLLGYFEEAGDLYLIQQYIKGPTLSKLIRRHGPWSEFEVQKFLLDILPLLQYLQHNQVIHRDIKPQNLIRRQEDQQLILIDFGAVKRTSQPDEILDADDTVSQTFFIGTMGFAAPEQIAMRPVYASDLYAVGVTCLFLLSGKNPQEFAVDFTTYELQWQEQIHVSDSFGEVLKALLKPMLVDRFQTATEVLQALSLILQGKPFTGRANGESDYFLDSSPSLCPTMPADPEEVDNYLPPSVREAIAIRQWRAKQESRIVYPPNFPGI